MFRRSFVVLAALTLAGFASGCSSDPSGTSSTTATSVTATTTTTTVRKAPATPVRPSEAPRMEPHPAAGHESAPAPVPAPAPVGADGSTGNNLGADYCAQNQDPGCPMGSYVGPNAVPNPDGSGGYVPCEGTVCTNPDHGAGTDPQQNGGAVMENPNGDGSEVPCEGTICTNPNNGAGG